MKTFVLLGLLLLALFAVVPAVADEDDTNKEAPAHPAQGHTQPQEHHQQNHQEHRPEQHHEQSNHRQHGKHSEHSEHSEHHTQGHWRHWRGQSHWQAFTIIWFYISIGLFILAAAMALGCVTFNVIRRCRSTTKEGFQPLVETKVPPQLDA
eukprot:TRINITY_DN1959_c0_g3_i2.p2 TRINITY_DN1959_c0_g3~~TRINITY_DN1959_c0_g3_i2.p2  ORF type:complete len:151 (-),score=14.01 TRINITY_DN1959_c0_g3_i2:311-763(-)